MIFDNIDDILLGLAFMKKYNIYPKEVHLTSKEYDKLYNTQLTDRRFKVYETALYYEMDDFTIAFKRLVDIESLQQKADRYDSIKNSIKELTK